MSTQYLQTTLDEIKDADIKRVILELEDVTRVSRDIYRKNSHLLHFLQGCIRPNGASAPVVVITKQMLDAHDYDNSYLLRKKIGKLKDTQVYWLCHEMALLSRISFETVLAKSLYVFINQSLNEAKKRKKEPPRNIYC